ncbi:MAG: transposase domain-containing protein [Candidatus Methylomirabilota bacterium]|jgi:hypothetical protein
MEKISPHAETEDERAGAQETFVPATVTAELLGITARAVRKRILAEGWDHRYVSARESRGKRLEIALTALPGVVQVRALQRAASNVQGPTSEVQEPKAGSGYETASPRDRAEADRRLALLTGWRQFVGTTGPQDHGPRGRTEATREFVRIQREAGQCVSKASLYAWAAAHQAQGPAGLVPRYSGGRSTSLAGADKALFLSVWGDQAQPKAATSYRAFLIVRARQASPGPAPTLHAVRYMLGHLSAEEKAALRMGAKAYRNVGPFIERDYETILPLEWFCMDHSPLDVICLDQQGRRCRPYITALQDLRTRRVVIVLSTQPNQDVVLYCLGKAILLWGIPDHLYVDNGKDFRARSVTGGRGKVFRLGLDEGRCRSLCDQLGVQAHFADPFNARAKPIERWFGTLEENVGKFFDTYCGRSTEMKPERLKEVLSAGKLPTFAEVERVITGWIETDYHERAHAGQGMNGRSPNQVWAELIGQVQVRRATREQLRYFLMRSPTVTVRRNQVSLLGRRYTPAVENLDCLYGWEGKEARARYDPQDASRVFLVDADDSPIGWLVEKTLLGFGAVPSAAIAEAKRQQARHRAQGRAVQAEQRAARNEPDGLKRVLRDHYANALPTDAHGTARPPAPPGRPGVPQILPVSTGARESARLVAHPPTEDARLHAVRARIQDEEPGSLEPRAARVRKPNAADLSDQVLEERYAARAARVTGD